MAYAEAIGRLAARMKSNVVSGGARGIDQAAMRGSLGGGGRAIGVLADNLGRAALNRDHRDLLMNGNLVLVSPFDPSAGFNVGNAMQRNKLIYALADAALVVSSDYQKGGTWAGAVEQLDKLHMVPVYVRSDGEASKGLSALAGKGALPWPNPESSGEFAAALAAPAVTQDATQTSFALGVREQPNDYSATNGAEPTPRGQSEVASAPRAAAEELFAAVRALMEKIDSPMTEDEIAAYLDVSKGQVKLWLARLVDEGALEKLKKPVRYCANRTSGKLL
jgi:predicted Rossmann fold nucleotide-binding protein DprA/Smf involved in DNA uptake